MTSPSADDFDGCSRDCRKAGAHTRVWGRCEHATPPEPTVSMARVIEAEDNFPCMVGFDTYTLEGLADLIEPALKDVKITLGPNSLMALEHGNTLGLTGGELRALALEAAYAIIHRNDQKAP